MSKDKEAPDTKEEGKEAPKDPASLAKELEGKIKLNKILLIVANSLFTLVLCILVTGFGVIYVKVSALSDTPQDKVDQELEKINKELEDLKTFRENEITSIDAFDEKIKSLQGDKESTEAATMRQVLLDRERDYQHLVDTLRNGTESLAGMVPGSRDWVNFYKGEMDTLKQHSIRRASSMESIPSDARDSKAEAAPASPAPDKALASH